MLLRQPRGEEAQPACSENTNTVPYPYVLCALSTYVAIHDARGGKV